MVHANHDYRSALRGKVHKSGRFEAQQPQRQHPSASTLRAFLSAHIGTPWKAVHEDYQRKFSVEPPHGHPDVLGTLVAVHTSLRQGRIHAHLPHAGVVPLEAVDCEFFVDPQLGTLLRNDHYVSPRQKERERAARRTEEMHARMREISAGAQAHKIGEVWYRIDLEHHPFASHGHGGRTASEQTVFDAVLGCFVTASDRFELERIYGRRGVYGVRRRALSWPELRELGLLSPAKAQAGKARHNLRRQPLL